MGLGPFDSVTRHLLATRYAFPVVAVAALLACDDSELPVAVAHSPSGAQAAATLDVTELIAVADAVSVTVLQIVTIEIDEVIAVVDVPGAIPPTVITVTETIGVNDAPASVRSAQLAVSEPLTVTDVPNVAVAAITPVVIAIDERIHIRDHAHATVHTDHE